MSNIPFVPQIDGIGGAMGIPQIGSRGGGGMDVHFCNPLPFLTSCDGPGVGRAGGVSRGVGQVGCQHMGIKMIRAAH